jgi:hypothetical protein
VADLDRHARWCCVRLRRWLRHHAFRSESLACGETWTPFGRGRWGRAASFKCVADFPSGSKETWASTDPKVLGRFLAPISHYFVTHLGALIEAAEAGFFYGGYVHEDIPAAVIWLNKAKALRWVEHFTVPVATSALNLRPSDGAQQEKPASVNRGALFRGQSNRAADEAGTLKETAPASGKRNVGPPVPSGAMGEQAASSQRRSLPLVPTKLRASFQQPFLGINGPRFELWWNGCGCQESFNGFRNPGPQAPGVKPSKVHGPRCDDLGPFPFQMPAILLPGIARRGLILNHRGAA